jgi:elongation factor P
MRKSLTDGSVLERTYKSGEKIEKADVEDRTMQFIYPEGEDFVFMDANTGDQVSVSGDKVGDDAKWLSDGMSVDITIYRGVPVGVALPAHVVLQIVQSEPGIKGDTASGATKPATLSTGAVVNVPLFVKEGEWVRVDTETGRYIERVNKK